MYKDIWKAIVGLRSIEKPLAFRPVIAQGSTWILPSYTAHFVFNFLLDNFSRIQSSWLTHPLKIKLPKKFSHDIYIYIYVIVVAWLNENVWFVAHVLMYSRGCSSTTNLREYINTRAANTKNVYLLMMRLAHYMCIVHTSSTFEGSNN